ncbi:MAG: hypothetical protein V3V45_00430 [Candidatus Brocadiales bacterium]
MPDAILDIRLDVRASVETSTFTTEVNRRDSLQFITTEFHIIPSSSPYRVRLDEVPDSESGVSVSGYSQVTSLPAQSGEFYVDWVMGYVYFHSADAGQVVNPQYFGRGSLIDAADINKITQELSYARDVTYRLRASAQDVPGTSISISAGSFMIGYTGVTFLGNNNIRLGTGGEFELSAMTAGHYNKVLFTVDSSARLKKYEGTSASTVDAAQPPAFPGGEMPVCILTVQDNGAAAAGTINNITAADVKDTRIFLQAPNVEHRYLTMYHAGFPAQGEIFFDGFSFGEDVTIDKITVHARSAPRGSDVQIDLMKNGSAQGRVATLAQDILSQTTATQSIAYAAGDTLGLKITAADSQERAEGLSVIVHYFIS